MTVLERRRMCWNKKPWPTAREAIESAFVRAPKVRLRAYRCPECGWFHVTRLKLR